MTTVKEIYEHIDSVAPFARQEGYDNSGLNIGRFGDEVDTVLIALDVTMDVAADAERLGAQLIITHHPVIFDPIKQISFDSVYGRLVRSGINLISAHTSFDSAKMNDILCEKLGLVPAEPLSIENGVPIGYICGCEPVKADELAERIGNALGNSCIRYNDTGREISRIAVCSGSGGSFLSEAISKNADCLITGDVKHNIFIDAFNAGVTVIDAGHYHTEVIFCEYMKENLSQRFPGVRFETAPSERDILSYRCK